MSLLISLIVSFIAVRGFRFELNNDGLVLGNTQSFVWLLLYLFFVWILYCNCHETDHKLQAAACAFGLMIGLFYTAGLSYEKKGTLAWIFESRSYLLNYLNLLFSYSFLYSSFAYLIYRYLGKQVTIRKNQSKISFKRILIVWGAMILLYMPWYLFCFPGIVTNDTADQIKQALGLVPLNNHHPIFLTLVIRLVLFITGKITGSVQTGIAVCSLLQMLLLTLVFAMAFERIRYYAPNRVISVLVFLWFVFYPVNSMFSITLWKDILFSACLLLLTVCLDLAAENKDDFFNSFGKCLLLFSSLFFLSLTRHNGILIAIIIVLCLLFRFSDYRRRIAVICSFSIGLWGVFQFLIIPSLDVKKADSGLFLSIPNQQLARALYYHNEEMSTDELEEIKAYFNYPEIWRKYRPKFADPVKELFRNDYFESDRIQFFKLWWKTGLRYPLEYIEAFLQNNYGYWFPETNYWITDYGVKEGAEEIGIHLSPLLKNGIIEKLYTFQMEQQFNKIPVIALFFKPGACWWVWVFCGLFSLYQNKKKFIIVMPGFMLWLSILFSPVYCEYRYAYGLFICLPLIMASVLTAGHNK